MAVQQIAKKLFDEIGRLEKIQDKLSQFDPDLMGETNSNLDSKIGTLKKTIDEMNVPIKNNTGQIFQARLGYDEFFKQANDLDENTAGEILEHFIQETTDLFDPKSTTIKGNNKCITKHVTEDSFILFLSNLINMAKNALKIPTITKQVYDEVLTDAKNAQTP
jgi:hypothetical protein